MRPTLPIVLRAALLAVLGFALMGLGRGGIAPFSDRGKIDFDTAMKLLNPYGTWAKVDDLWAFTPLDHGVPYTHGRWIYTEYGWTWQGTVPHSWMTEHYGYWKRNENKIWQWFPGPYWLPQTVELRAASAGIGWRSAQVDGDGNFVESPADRYTKTDEWTFVSLQQFAEPITPAVIAKPGEVEGLLEESTESIHSYLTYRQIDRPGPHPADFVTLGDGRMFAPMTAQDRQKALRPPPKPAPKSDVPQPMLAGTDPEDPANDPRQVVYWVTMSLPTIWTDPPPDARRNQVYIYRPEIYQDQDGIERRIALWLDPSIRAKEALHLQQVLANTHASPHPAAPIATGPGAPAMPADDSPSPFASPFEDSFQASADKKTPSASTKNPKLNAGAPISAAGAPISAAGAPIGTNAAPAPATVGP
jgi:hypothetical protein